LTSLRLLVGLVGVLATGACLVAPDDINLTFDRGAVRIGDNIVERLGIDLKAARTIADASGEVDWQKAYNRAQLDLITQADLPHHATGELYTRLLKDRYWGKTDSRIV